MGRRQIAPPSSETVATAAIRIQSSDGMTFRLPIMFCLSALEYRQGEGLLPTRLCSACDHGAATLGEANRPR